MGIFFEQGSVRVMGRWSLVIGPSTVTMHRVATCLALLVFPILTQQGWAEDVVVVARTQPPGELRRRGTIVEYTGQALTLKLASEREETIESARVLGFETTRVPDQENGDQLFAEGRFADAVANYRRAVDREQRTWMRRVILAQMVRCYRNMQQMVRAGDTFLIVMRSDPTTQLLDAIPLAWVSTPPPADLVQRSSQWLEDAKIPAARLLGASWLLATGQRQPALDVLKKLTEDPDPRIALLAEAQLWRDQIVTASPEDIQEWQQLQGKLDVALQAGPNFLLGQALARQNRSGAAALAFLRIPVLAPDQYDLAAEALFAAGEQLEKMGDRSGTRTVYRELVQTYGKHRLASAAQQRLLRDAGK